MTQQQISNEVKYRIALAFLKKLLQQGIITEQEFIEADRLNAQCYKPVILAI